MRVALTLKLTSVQQLSTPTLSNPPPQHTLASSAAALYSSPKPHSRFVSLLRVRHTPGPLALALCSYDETSDEASDPGKTLDPSLSVPQPPLVVVYPVAFGRAFGLRAEASILVLQAEEPAIEGTNMLS